MEKNETTKVEGYRFISNEEKLIIFEIRRMCYIRRTEEREAFLREVAESVGCNKISEIKSEDFGTAYLTAEAILHRYGDAVFQPQTFISDIE